MDNTKYDIKKVGERIKYLIESNNLKASNICQLDRNGVINERKCLPMARQTLSKAIKGEAELSFNQLIAICNFFNVSLDYLLGESDYTSKEKEVAGKLLGFHEMALDNISSAYKKHNKGFYLLNYLLSCDYDLISYFFDILYQQCLYTFPEEFMDNYEIGEVVKNKADLCRIEVIDILKRIVERVGNTDSFRDNEGNIKDISMPFTPKHTTLGKEYPKDCERYEEYRKTGIVIFFKDIKGFENIESPEDS